MNFEVLFTEGAESDLVEIADYVASADRYPRASRVLDRIEQVMLSLADLPQRGAHPTELLAIGIREYREVFFKPYRLVYRIDGRRAIVYLIVDGRRDMQRLLMRRLLGA